MGQEIWAFFSTKLVKLQWCTLHREFFFSKLPFPPFFSSLSFCMRENISSGVEVFGHLAFSFNTFFLSLALSF